jgi:hypothetical protein
MRRRWAAAILIAALCRATAAAAALQVGDRAPDFALADQTGKPIRLSEFRGKSNVVLAFYVMAFTPG